MRRRGRIKQSEKSAAVKIIKQRYGSTAQIILGTASGMLSALLTEGVCLHSVKKIKIFLFFSLYNVFLSVSSDKTRVVPRRNGAGITKTAFFSVKVSVSG